MKFNMIIIRKFQLAAKLDMRHNCRADFLQFSTLSREEIQHLQNFQNSAICSLYVLDLSASWCPRISTVSHEHVEWVEILKSLLADTSSI